MYFLCYCQLSGHRVVVKVAVVIVVASVRAVIKIMGYGLENTRVLIPRGDPVSGSTPFHWGFFSAQPLTYRHSRS
jgi:hypothetical protein